MTPEDSLAGDPTTEKPQTGGVADQASKRTAGQAPVARKAVPPAAAAPQLPAAAGTPSSRPRRAQREPGTGADSSMEADGAVPGGGPGPGCGDPAVLLPPPPGQGDTGLRGKEARDAIRKAESARAAEKRRNRFRRAARTAGPGMVRWVPPGGDGAA